MCNKRLSAQLTDRSLLLLGKPVSWGDYEAETIHVDDVGSKPFVIGLVADGSQLQVSPDDGSWKSAREGTPNLKL